MKGQRSALWTITLVHAITFSVWVLYAALLLHPALKAEFSDGQITVLLACPLLSAAIASLCINPVLRRIGSKTAVSILMALLLPTLLLLTTAASFPLLLMLGILLGLASIAYLLGLDYLSPWLTRGQEGTLLGFYGAGDLGVLLTFILVPWLLTNAGVTLVGPVLSGLVLLILLLFLAAAPSNPTRNAARHPLKDLLKDSRVWRFGLYNFFAFGSFLVLLMWLPRYYQAAYGYSATQAAAFTLVFATVSGLMRALGGWFSDRYGGRTMNWTVFWVCLVCLFFLSYPPTTMTIHGINHNVELRIEINAAVFSVLVCIMGAALGFGRASLGKLISDYYPGDLAAVAGIANAIAALGACMLALAFALAQSLLGIHSAVFMLMYGLLAACMITMHFANKSDRQALRLQAALENNFLEMD